MIRLNIISILTVASVSTQIAQLTSAPIITRMNSPEFYGTSMKYITTVSILFPIINLRIEGPIFVSKNADKIVNLIRICFLTAGIVLLISTNFSYSIYSVSVSSDEYSSDIFTLVMMASYNTTYYSLLRS